MFIARSWKMKTNWFYNVICSLFTIQTETYKNEWKRSNIAMIYSISFHKIFKDLEEPIISRHKDPKW